MFITIKKIFLLGFIFFIFNYYVPLQAKSSTTHPKALFDDALRHVIFEDINAYRSAHGLHQLKLNHYICEVATKHSVDMAKNIAPLGHAGFNKRIKIIFDHFNQPRSIAENVAFTDSNPKQVVNLWLNSSGHRKNIEGNYNITGIGIAHGENGRVFVTQIFLKELAERTA